MSAFLRSVLAALLLLALSGCCGPASVEPIVFDHEVKIVARDTAFMRGLYIPLRAGLIIRDGSAVPFIGHPDSVVFGSGCIVVENGQRYRVRGSLAFVVTKEASK